MKSYRVKEFKAYQSVKFGKSQVNHFYKNKSNPVKQYLKDIEMDFIPELNSIFVRGSEGSTFVNMSNVSDWIPEDTEAIENQLNQPKAEYVPKADGTGKQRKNN